MPQGMSGDQRTASSVGSHLPCLRHGFFLVIPLCTPGYLVRELLEGVLSMPSVSAQKQ